MLQITSGLLAKAVTLYSTTIDSPNDRTNKDGAAIRPTIYFDKPVTKDGKHVPGKKSKLYTPDADEAASLKATQDGVESLMLDGAGKYSPDNDNHHRFLKSTLSPADVAEIKTIKGKLSCNKQVLKVKATMKACVSAYIMGLPQDQRNQFADALAQIAMPTIDALKNAVDDSEEDTPLFS
jgi:hypothetical protein